MVDISHRTSKPKLTNCTSAMMQLCSSKTSQEISVLDHPSEILGKGSSAHDGSDTYRSVSDYLCKKLGMMSCRHVLLAFVHASLKLDALLLQRLLGAGHM